MPTGGVGFHSCDGKVDGITINVKAWVANGRLDISTTKALDPADYGVGHGERRPLSAVDLLSRQEAKEVIASCPMIVGAKGDDSQRSGIECVGG